MKGPCTMCLGIPGKVIETNETGGMLMGRVDFGGAVREACLAYVPDVEVGQYVIVHVGFAISVLNEDEAMETLELIKTVYELDEELAESNPSTPLE